LAIINQKQDLKGVILA